MRTLLAARMFDGLRFADGIDIAIRGDTVVAVQPGAAGARLPEDWLIVPGFVDLQVNGGGGVMFNAVPTAAGARAIAAAHARVGTTALLPTLISDRALFTPALGAVAEAARDEPAIIGLHLEGPFINPARRGIHPGAKLGPPTEIDLECLRVERDIRVLLTLAPEVLSPSHLRRLGNGRLNLFAGHTDATYEQATDAFAAGVTGVTHLFNAMSQFGSRAPGCVGAALAHESASAGIIVDGLHVHPASVRIAWQALGPDRLFLVSDAMPTAASATTSFEWDGETISLRDGLLSRADGTLAGAHLTMAEAVRNAVHLCGIPLGDALRMATSTPAAQIEATRLGRIAPGCRADLVALDAALRVVAVWRGGARLPP